MSPKGLRRSHAYKRRRFVHTVHAPHHALLTHAVVNPVNPAIHIPTESSTLTLPVRPAGCPVNLTDKSCIRVILRAIFTRDTLTINHALGRQSRLSQKHITQEYLPKVLKPVNTQLDDVLNVQAYRLINRDQLCRKGHCGNRQTHTGAEAPQHIRSFRSDLRPQRFIDFQNDWRE